MSLYKYVVAERLDVLQNARIRFTQPSALNDPFEMQPVFNNLAPESYFREELESSKEMLLENALRLVHEQLPPPIRQEMTLEVLKRKLSEHPSGIEQLIEQAIDQTMRAAAVITPTVRPKLIEGLNQHVGMLSLTEKPDNLLMWSHYARYHQGMVIEFDDEHPYFHQRRSLQDEFGYVRKVVYSSERPNFESVIDMDGTDAFLVKSKDWEYEQEWRILRPLKDADQTIANDQGSICLFSIPSDCIIGVILGCRISDASKQLVTDFLARDIRYRHVKVFRAVQSDKSFAVEIIPEPASRSSAA